MAKMNPVVHFELPAENRQRVAEFYAKVFGWQTNQMGPEMGNYIVVMTTESTKQGPKKSGIINGGIYQKTPEMPPQHPSFVIAVDDINGHIKIVERSGGKVLGKPAEIPGVGWYVSFTDTEGNRLSMLQPFPMKQEDKAKPASKPATKKAKPAAKKK